jgi:hypothetical protein
MAWALNGCHARQHDENVHVKPLPLSPTRQSPSFEEAAAIVAALERFMRATAPALGAPATTAADPWRQAAVQEGLDSAKRHDLPDPWINT